MADPYDLPPGAKIISVPQEYDLPPGAKLVSGPRADRGGMGPGEPDVPNTSRAWSDVGAGFVTNFLPSLYKQFEGIYDAVTNPAQTAEGLKALGEGAASKVGRLTGLTDVSPEEAKKAAELLKTLEGRDPSEKVILPGFGVGTVGDLLPRVQRAAAYTDPEKGRGMDAQKEAAFNAVVDHYVQRYGSMEGFKKALEEDPASVFLDLSTVLTGVGGIARGAANTAVQGSKIANVAGKAADALSWAGRTTDPVAQSINAALKVPGLAGKAASEILGVTTGVGSAPIETAFKVGRESTGPAWSPRTQESLARLKEGMRGKPDIGALIADAKTALKNVMGDAQAAYEQHKNGPSGWAQDTTRLDFQPIRDTFDRVYASMFNRRTGISKVTDPGQMEKINKIKEKLAEWEANPGAHNLEGLDDLKQAVWGMRGSADQRQVNRMVNSLYGQIKGIVNKQSDVIYQGRPNEYRLSQRKYDRDMKQLEEIEKSLSLGDNVTADTAVRKLLSVMRDNVYTNYGKRAESAATLESLGGANIMPELAGMTLASKMPRGLMRAVLGANLLTVTPQAIGTLLRLPLMSPRLAGEAALATGQGVGAFDRFVAPQAKKVPDWLKGHPTTLGIGQLGQMYDTVERKRGGHLRTTRSR